MDDLLSAFLSGDETELTLLYWALLPFFLVAAGISATVKKVREASRSHHRSRVAASSQASAAMTPAMSPASPQPSSTHQSSRQVQPAPEARVSQPSATSQRGDASVSGDSVAGAHPADGASGTSVSGENRSVPGGEFTPWISAEEKTRIARKYNWVCQLCLKPIDPNISFDYESPDPGRLVIDHVKPRKHGGTDDSKNLQPAHHRCNTKKGGKWITNEEFRKWEAIRSSEASTRQQRPALSTIDSSAATPRSRGHRSSPLSSSRSASRARTSGRVTKPHVRRPHVHAEPKYTRPPSNPTIRALRAQLPTARLSPLMRARAERFLDEEHPYGLLTECQRGHEFTLENTYFSLDDGGVKRQCRSCRRRS